MTIAILIILLATKIVANKYFAFFKFFIIVLCLLFFLFFISDYCYIPNLKIVEFCKQEKIPSICFPKGLKEKYATSEPEISPEQITRIIHVIIRIKFEGSSKILII